MNTSKRSKAINYICKIAIMGALAGIVMLLKFPILPTAPFLEFDFSNVIVLISGFALGPFAAFLVASIRLAIDCMGGSATGYVGEFSAWLLCMTYSVPASILYKYKKGFKWAMVAVAISLVLSNLMGIVSNWFIMFPLFGIPAEAIPNMIVTAVIPFNLIKFSIISVCVLLLYKPLSPVLKHNFQAKKKTVTKNQMVLEDGKADQVNNLEINKEEQKD